MIIDNKIQRTFPGPLTIIGITFLFLAIVLVLTGLWYVAVLLFFIVDDLVTFRITVLFFPKLLRWSFLQVVWFRRG